MIAAYDAYLRIVSKDSRVTSRRSRDARRRGLFGIGWGLGNVDQLPRIIELGQALDDAVLAAAAEPLPKLAARLMSELFGSQYHPGEWVDLNAAAGPLMPPNSGSKFGDPTPDGVRILDDIAVEAMQLLEHANLIAPAFWYSGNVWFFGYRSTRAGRTAVEQGTVEKILTSGSG